MQTNILALNKLEERISQDVDMSDEEKLAYYKEIEKLRNPLKTDKLIYRIVVFGLILAILASLGFTFYLSLKSADLEKTIAIPEIFIAVGSAAVGALAGLLAPSPSRDETT